MPTKHPWATAPTDRPFNMSFKNGREERAQWEDKRWKVLRQSGQWVTMGFDTPQPEDAFEWWD